AVHVDVAGAAGVDAGDVQHAAVAPAAHHGGQGGVVLPPSDDGRARPVPAQDAGGPVGKVGDPAQHLAPDDQTVFALAGGQQSFGGVQAVDKAGAGRVQVKADGVLGQAQLLLQDAGGRGGHGVLGQGGHQADA